MKKLIKYLITLFFKFKPTNFDLEGKEVVLLCNGPSLNEVDFSKIRLPLIGLNKIFLKKNIHNRLTFVVSVNKFVIRQMAKNKYARELHRKIPIYIPSHRFINKIFLRKASFINLSNKNEFVDKSMIFGVGSTVTYVALQILFKLNVSKVYVIGMDHNFNQVGNSNETQKLKGNDLNHFDPNYFKNMKWQLADLENSENSYATAQKLFMESNKKIVNVGNSKYNGWEKITLSEFYKLTSTNEA
jgi:hypothetical protein